MRGRSAANTIFRRPCDIGDVRKSGSVLNAVLILLLLASSAQAQRSYFGVDRNEYPGDANMATLHRTFAFTGYWLNNPPRADHNSWQGKRKSLEARGYGFLLLFNGREYAQLKASGKAARVGTNDAGTAVDAAEREGFPKGAIIFLDQEQGGRMLPEQRAYIHAWVDEVTHRGYRAGVYCSGIPFRESNKVSVITADDIRENAGARKISFFVSNDQCPPSPGCVFAQAAPAPAGSGVSFADAWQFAQSPRRPNVTKACRQTYAQNGSCYPPGMPAGANLYIDVDSASSADPSQGRK
jgi:hypothetical protein